MTRALFHHLEKALNRDPDSSFDEGACSGLWLAGLTPRSELTAPPRVDATGIILRRTHLDEEDLLTKIEENSQDAIVSTLGLHWINDLPGQSILLTRHHPDSGSAC